MRALSQDERKSAYILAGIAVAEGAWCAANLRAAGAERFFVYAGLVNGHASFGGWSLAIIVFAAFIALAARLPSVRQNLFVPSRLKLLGLAVALTAAFCEESIFRKQLMNGVAGSGHGLLAQVLVSGLAFGLAHGIWGAFRGSVTAAIGATISTGLLGAALAAVYLASARDLAPCIVAHFLVNILAEPGLVLAAVRGEMSRQRIREPVAA